MKARLEVGKALSCWSGLAEFHTGYVAAKGDVTELAPHPIRGWNLNLFFWNSLRYSGIVGLNAGVGCCLQISGFGKGRTWLRRTSMEMLG